MNTLLGICPREMKTCIYPHKDLYMNILSSIIYNSLKVKTIQMPTNWWIVEKCGLFTQWNIIQQWKGPSLWYLLVIDGPQKYYAKWKKPNTRDQILYHSIYLNVQRRQMCKDRAQISDCLELGGDGD